MDIKDLRAIGKRLMDEVAPFIDKFVGNTPIGKGASGDMTYPIDKKAEEIIFEEIRKLDKPFILISEEHGYKNINGGGPKILIDPIDGSKNAISGLPLFSTSIAKVDGDTIKDITLGYVINLVNGDEFWASKGKGSFFNGTPVNSQHDEVLRVAAYEAQTPIRDIPKILPLLSLFRRTRCLGSIAMDLALVARGSLSMFISPTPSRSFDIASGYLLVKEAGGIITGIDGKSIDSMPVGMGRISPILASGNERLHKTALEVLAKAIS